MSSLIVMLGSNTIEGKILKFLSTYRLSLSVVILSFLAPMQLAYSNSDPEDKFQQAVELFISSEYSKAHILFEELDSKFKKRASFRFYYALSLVKNGHHKQAIKEVKQAIELDPKNAHFRYGLATIYEIRAHEIGIIRGTLLAKTYKKTLLKVLELDPAHVNATKDLIIFLYSYPSIVGGNAKEALALIPKLKKLDKATGLQQEAIFEWNNQNIDRAEDLFLMAYNTPESGPSIRLSLSEFYMRKKQYRKAVDFLLEFLSMPKIWSEKLGNSRAHFYLALAYHHLSDDFNFKRHTQAAEKTNLYPHEKKLIKSEYKRLGIEYY